MKRRRVLIAAVAVMLIALITSCEPDVVQGNKLLSGFLKEWKAYGIPVPDEETGFPESSENIRSVHYISAERYSSEMQYWIDAAISDREGYEYKYTYNCQTDINVPLIEHHRAPNGEGKILYTVEQDYQYGTNSLRTVDWGARMDTVISDEVSAVFTSGDLSWKIEVSDEDDGRKHTVSVEFLTDKPHSFSYTRLADEISWGSADGVYIPSDSMKKFRKKLQPVIDVLDVYADKVCGFSPVHPNDPRLVEEDPVT